MTISKLIKFCLLSAPGFLLSFGVHAGDMNADLVAQKQAAQHIRVVDLQSNEKPVTSFEGARTKWRPTSGQSIILSPPFEPDQKIYYYSIELERKIGDAYVGSIGKIHYAFLIIDKNSVIPNGYTLRANAPSSFVGKFVKTTEYTTVGGERRIAPVFQIFYIGPMDLNALY